MTASRTPRRWLPGWVTASLWLVALVSVPLLIDQWRHRDAPDSLPAQVLVDLEGTRRDTHPVVTIALSSGTPGQVADYAAEHELGFRIVNDPHGDISRAWGVAVTPTLAVVHRGEIRSMTSGVTTPPGISLRLWMSGLLGSGGGE